MAFHYQVEVRNLADAIVLRLQSRISSLSWSYDALGGCGDATLALREAFDNFGDINLEYDVQIWRVEDPFGSPGSVRLPAMLPIELGTAFTSSRELRWSGFVREPLPNLAETETVSLGLSGYQRQLQYVGLDDVVYQAMDVGAIVAHILDNYVVPVTRIKRTVALGLVQTIGVPAAELRFDASAYDAIQTLSQIGQNAEWGVRADREFYFLPRSTTIKQTWEVGDRVKFYQPRYSTDDVVTKVFLRGVGNFKATLINAAYGGTLQKHRHEFAAGVANATDAELWGTAYFAKHGTAQPKGRIGISATDAWIENVTGQTMPPLGRLRVHGGPQFVASGDPGDPLPSMLPLKLGGVHFGVTDQAYRIESIRYTPTENGLDIEVDLGEKRGSITDAFKSIEHRLTELRQGFTL